jgi:hypothetical protein
VDASREALFVAFATAREAGDREAMVAAALALPTSQRFGVHAGQVPALLHEAYSAVEDPFTRCRLASALARSWVYGGNAGRAATFADQAQRLAAEVATPEAMADALDAALLAHWGPDTFAERLSLAARLDDVAAHLGDPDLRMSAHLWRLTTAWECLDIVAVQRQLRALDIVAEESGSARIAFFAASRRATHALVLDDLAAADALIGRTAELGRDVALPDVDAVLYELSAARALAAGDLVALRELAVAYQEFGAAEGIPSVSAVGATVWLAAGHTDEAAQLVTQLMSGGIEGISRDVDFLLTLTSVVSVAAELGLADIAREGSTALEQYCGRCVLNAGAVTFHGIVDDYVYRARRSLGQDDADRWRHAAEIAYRRIGARRWERALAGSRPHLQHGPARSVRLQRDQSGRWTVGPDGVTFELADLRGLHYVRYLVERPGAEVEALALSDAAAGHAGGGFDQTDLGEVVDSAALEAYRRRLLAIDAELDAADKRGDQSRGTELSAERDAIIDQLRGATGLAGRLRRPGSSAERARVAVRKAIAAALTQIEAHDPGLARLLRDSLRTGASCRYEPNPSQPVIWLTN